TYAVSASGTGLESGLSGRTQASISGDQAAVTAEVRLAPSGTVNGRFLKADGQTPIADGQVKLLHNGQVLVYTTSATDGSFGMQYVPLGDFSVEGYDPVTMRWGRGGGRLNANGDVVAADVVVTPRGTLKGSVLNYGGSAPIGGARVTIGVSGVSSYNFTTVTAPDGSFLFSGVPAGRFTVDAADPGTGFHGQASGTLSYENETVQTEVHIAAIGAIAGRVLMPDGVTPVTAATVRLNGGTPMPVDATTGEFRYDNLAIGTSYSLSASQTGTRRTGFSVVAATHDLEVARGDIVLGGVGSVQGTVFDTAGTTALASAKVELHFGTTVLTSYTGADGSFSFGDIPTGPFTVVAPSDAGRTTGASQSGFLQAEGSVATVNLVLGPVASVKATVLLADGVTPSRGGGIRLTINPGTNHEQVMTGITDSDGQYLFTGIPTPCTFFLYVEDAVGAGIGKASGSLDQNGQVFETGTIVLDDKPIFVTSVNPATGAVSVAIDQQIRVLFSEPADPATVNQNSVYLTQGGTRVRGNVFLDADNTEATFIPVEPLKGYTLYTLVVTGTVTDRVGRRLALPQSVSFTTIDNIPPTVLSVSPADGSDQVTADAVVRITFSEPVNSATLDAMKLLRGGVSVDTRLDLLQGGTVAVLTPLAPLDLNATYTVSVSGIQDLAYNTLQGTALSAFATIDTIVPTVTVLTVPPTAGIIKGNVPRAPRGST
ncbi:MAG TPA: Ig-like domain-containing protein, partial [Geobacteraceae bacterium]